MGNRSRFQIILLVAVGIILSDPVIAGQTTWVNGQAVSLVDSRGVSFAFPSVCKTPGPAGPIPIPYPNVAQSSDTSTGTQKVKTEGEKPLRKGSGDSKSTGDEAGAVRAIASKTFKEHAEFVLSSFDVKVEGKNSARSFDLMLHNNKNTPPMPVLQGPISVMPRSADSPMPEEMMVDPSQLKVMVTDNQGNRRELRRSKLFQLEDGTFCAVCMKKKKVTQILRLYSDTPPQ